MCQYSSLWKVDLQVFTHSQDIRVQQRQRAIQVIEMAYGAPGRDKQQNLKEAHHILRIKRIPPRAEVKRGAQLILKEIQKLAFKLHPLPAKLRRVIILPLIHKKLLLQPIPKIR